MEGNWLVLVVLVLSTVTCSLGEDEFACHGKLLLSHVLCRYAAKSPASLLPSDCSKELFGVKPNEITQLGRDQAWEVGASLKDHFAGFLPDVYSSEDVKLRTSDEDFTHISLAAVMKGIFGPTAPAKELKVYYQHVPGYTQPLDIDLLLPMVRSPCPGFRAELDRITNSTEYQKFMHQMAYLEEFSRSVSGLSAIELYDNLESKAYHGLPLPDLCHKVFPALTSYVAGSLYFNVASTERLRRMYHGRYMQDVAGHMVKKIKGTLKPDRKVFVYGGHAANVLAHLAAMEVWDGQIPSYSACVNVELRLKHKNEYVVTVSYRNDTSQPARLLKLPKCSCVACPLDEFLQATDAEVLNMHECLGQPLPPTPPGVPPPGTRLLPLLPEFVIPVTNDLHSYPRCV
ncbi:venom acid phosphatase Acph-1-like [Bacillus rossius redtenbacheri]|uniref:venom acid phosphatase Acph-1-like n=1 Tax=Bacillus rossius redtenbacheri TaxID=93214 RepID=UPI002FDE9721